MKLAAAVAVLFGFAVLAQATAIKANYKVSRLSPSQVAVSCLNGGEPVVYKRGDVVILSCGD